MKRNKVKGVRGRETKDKEYKTKERTKQNTNS